MITCGVYLIMYPEGVYVGQSTNCERRNADRCFGGVTWKMAVVLPPTATIKELLLAERKVADELSAYSVVLVSKNTTEHLKVVARARAIKSGLAQRGRSTGRPMPSGHKEKMCAGYQRWRQGGGDPGAFWTPEQRQSRSEKMKAFWAAMPKEARSAYVRGAA